MAIDPNFVIKTKSGSFGSANEVRLEITNWNEVMTILKDLDETWIRDLRKEFKEIGKIGQTAVKRAIPDKSNPPMSQMKQVHFGRLAWGTTWGGGGKKPRPAKSVLIQTPNTRKKKYRELERIPVVRLQIGSPGTVLFDMGGRAKYSKGRKGLTPVYDYMYTINGRKVPGKRQHRVVPFAFAKGTAGAKGKLQMTASRIVWPAVEKAMPAITRKMREVVYDTNRKIQLRLLRTQ